MLPLKALTTADGLRLVKLVSQAGYISGQLENSSREKKHSVLGFFSQSSGSNKQPMICSPSEDKHTGRIYKGLTFVDPYMKLCDNEYQVFDST